MMASDGRGTNSPRLPSNVVVRLIGKIEQVNSTQYLERATRLQGAK